MSLYFVGLGIANIKNLSLKGLEILKKSDIIFLENYTNLFENSKEEIENFIGKKVEILKRKDIEEDYKKILKLAKTKEVSILIFGDPFFATTHIFLKNEAIKNNINVEVIHSSSSLCSIFAYGISSYKIGKIVTIPLKSKIFDFPRSIYETIKLNKDRNLHTICLLDIDIENNEFLKPKEALKFLLDMENHFKENVISKEDVVLVLSRIGYKDENIYFGRIEKIRDLEIEIPAIIVLLSELSVIEKESLNLIPNKYF